MPKSQSHIGIAAKAELILLSDRIRSAVAAIHAANKSKPSSTEVAAAISENDQALADAIFSVDRPPGFFVMELRDLDRCRRLLDEANYDRLVRDLLDCIRDADLGVQMSERLTPDVLDTMPLSHAGLRRFIDEFEVRLQAVKLELSPTVADYRQAIDMPIDVDGHDSTDSDD